MKQLMTEPLEDWMTHGGQVDSGIAKMSRHQLVVKWIVGAYKNISTEMGWNS